MDFQILQFGWVSAIFNAKFGNVSFWKKSLYNMLRIYYKTIFLLGDISNFFFDFWILQWSWWVVSFPSQDHSRKLRIERHIIYLIVCYKSSCICEINSITAIIWIIIWSNKCYSQWIWNRCKQCAISIIVRPTIGWRGIILSIIFI